MESINNKSVKTIASGYANGNTMESAVCTDHDCEFDKSLQMTDNNIKWNGTVLKELYQNEVNNSSMYNFIKYLVEEVEELKKTVKEQQETIDSLYCSDDEILEI
jgi:hypothetical protein